MHSCIPYLVNLFLLGPSYVCVYIYIDICIYNFLPPKVICHSIELLKRRQDKTRQGQSIPNLTLSHPIVILIHLFLFT